MSRKQSIQSLMKWLLAFVIAVILLLAIRQWCIGSYLISTGAMEETLHTGDYVLVNKYPLAGKPQRNQVVLFHNPVTPDSISSSLLISRCIGLPGDTLQVDANGYLVNGDSYPLSPLSRNIYKVSGRFKSVCLETLQTLHIPLRDWVQQGESYTLQLTPFEAWQIQEEIGAQEVLELLQASTAYSLIVPRKDRAYRLDEASLPFCREAIRRETNGKARFHEGKLYLDGRETTFFFFKQDYYWLLSDNTAEAVDSRYLGFVPADHLVGNVWCCWYSYNREKIFTSVH